MNDIVSEMQRLQISNNKSIDDDEDALLEAAINLAAVEKEELQAGRNNEVNNFKQCDHGFVPYPRNHVCIAFRKSLSTLARNYSTKFQDIYEATKTTFADVWNDPDKLLWVASDLLSFGAKETLQGGYKSIGYLACTACFFEQWAAMVTHDNETAAVAGHENDAQTSCKWDKFEDLCDWGKMLELREGDEHTVVSFFKKRIPCKCLDEKLKEVKSIAKIGFCYNPTCSLPDNKTARGKMLYCTRCRRANYCSRECQKAHWTMHKEDCVVTANRLTAQKSTKKK